ncbi:hypothetical protein U1Q18_043125 [Sarracenia purpurea var. burkii]
MGIVLECTLCWGLVSVFLRSEVYAEKLAALLEGVLRASTCEIVLPVASSLAKQVHAQVVKSNVEADDVLFTGLVDSDVKSGRVDYARRVFDMMLEKNVVCSTSMILGYMNQGSVKEAEYIFKRTQEKDVVVYNAMIEGYSKSLETA